MCLIALTLIFAPPAVTDPVRTGVRDAMLPGERLLNWAVESWSPRSQQSSEAAEMQSAVEAWKLHCRKLEMEIALLNEKLDEAQRLGVAPGGATAGPPLIVPELIQANVLGEETAALWRSGRLLDRGRYDGLTDSDLVLTGGALIDQGEPAGLETGQPVYSGRSVVGRVARVGRWTSTVVPITDPSFRGRAQLVRKTSRGHVFGAQGVLKGTGEPHCRLELVAAGESVGVGDEVYTAARDGALPYPMYYGRVVDAELEPGALHWHIRVEPAVEDVPATTVQVLRRALNPVRRLAN